MVASAYNVRGRPVVPPPNPSHPDVTDRSAPAAHPASAILFTPTGTIAATDVQAAIVEAAAEGVTSDALKIDKATLTVDGNILTRAAGVPSEITRAALAADTAFTSVYMKGTSGAGAPGGSGTQGEWYWDTTNKREYLSDGTGWVIMSEPEQTFTPTWGNVTLGTSSLVVGKYHRSDGFVDWSSQVVLGTGGAVTGVVNTSLPVAFAVHGRGAFNVYFRDASVADYQGFHEATGAGATTVNILGASVAGALLSYINTGAAAPFTWAINDQIIISGRAKMNTRYL